MHVCSVPERRGRLDGTLDFLRSGSTVSTKGNAVAIPSSIARPCIQLLGLLLVVPIAFAACGTSTSPGASATPSQPATSASGSPSAPPSAGEQPVSPEASGGAADQLQSQYVAVVQQVSPSVVVIETTSGLGSGIVFDGKGDIVTNAHVVGNESRFKVTTADGKSFNATLVGTFPANDVAVVNVSDGNLKPATFGDSSKLVVGDIVMAIGNPLGLQSSVTEGIVSALGRTVTEPGGAALPSVIQTSAPINPGNSGGALVNLSAEVVGIPTLAATDPQLGGTAPGIGFAIPSNAAKDIATQLIEHGKVVSTHRAYLGIRAANVSGGGGVLVYEVEAGGPAARAGIKPGDLIVSVADKDTPDLETLAAVLADLAPGQTVPVKVEHSDGSTTTAQVTLGELPG
ncbi:MAG: PDZ domain-containing protein [Chloroflexi bacterium]|nr:MAG: PDZ domain-containing protein [Chloroflexota bacterium]